MSSRQPEGEKRKRNSGKGELQEQKYRGVTQPDRWGTAWGIEKMANLRPD